VPDSYDPYARTTDIPEAWWTTTGELVGSQKRPDNYFTASNPAQMVTGLTRAFAKAAADLRAFTTSFATSLPQIALSGSASYGAKYDASDWSGEIVASSVTYNVTTRQPEITPVWSFSAKLATQIAGTGWNTNRRMITWNPSTATGVPFRWADISTAQQGTLDTIYRSGADGADYLNYLRGDPTHEEASSTGSKMYRTRTNVVGDISGSKVKPVGKPSAQFSDAANPGYSAFKTANASRATILYVGSNAGMMHAIEGELTAGSPGREIFAYVPSALYDGPTGTPIVNGLQSRGDPDFTHKPLVDGPIAVFDVNLGRTVGGSGTNWRTMLVGSLGKGGKSYYAIDVTNPAALTSESLAAAKVMWEFSHTDLGYTYGEPAAVKTKKYGWVLIFGSGYNNADGKGYFFIVNPRTGLLLEKIGTGAGTSTAQAGMAQVEAFVPDRTDYTADAVYAGDLLGNIWRLDLTAASGAYPAPVKLATLTNAAGAAVPVTTRPLIINHARLNRRFVTVGTGRLLDISDISSTQAQLFAAIADGTGSSFSVDSTMTTAPATMPRQPSGITFPVVRSNLKENTDLTVPVSVDFTTQAGWWLDLGTSAAGLGWRVVTDSSAFDGRVTFAAMLPNGDVCSPNGISRLYSIDVGTGESQLLNALGDTVAYLPSTSNIIETRTYSVDGKGELFVSDDRGVTRRADTRARATLGLRRLNWRELPLAD
jgi:type IV pilus assembly protein PilY1